jgi:hypothetical protein
MADLGGALMEIEKVVDPHKAVDFLFEHANAYAAAKALRIYTEEFRKSKKAMLMKESLETAIGAQEREAYAHPEYVELLKDLQKHVTDEETLRWKLTAAQARIEIYRTQQANLRAEGKATI